MRPLTAERERKRRESSASARRASGQLDPAGQRAAADRHVQRQRRQRRHADALGRDQARRRRGPLHQPPSGATGGDAGSLDAAAPVAAAAAGANEVTGRVIGDANADCRHPRPLAVEGIAPGLLGAKAGGEPSPAWALGIGCGLLLCAGVGSQLDRRRPRLRRPA